MIYLYNENGERLYPYIAWYIHLDDSDKESCKLYFCKDYEDAKKAAKEHYPKGYKLYNVDAKMPLEKGIYIL